MNRVIKFRAWHNTTVSGNFVMSPHEEIVKNCGTYLCDNDKFPNRIIMQFTGLTDKNGIDIYEGDIIEYMGEIIEVEYFDFIFRCMINGECDAWDEHINTKECIVIGNIHQNPELLNN